MYTMNTLKIVAQVNEILDTHDHSSFSRYGEFDAYLTLAANLDWARFSAECHLDLISDYGTNQWYRLRGLEEEIAYVAQFNILEDFIENR